MEAKGHGLERTEQLDTQSEPAHLVWPHSRPRTSCHGPRCSSYPSKRLADHDDLWPAHSHDHRRRRRNAQDQQEGQSRLTPAAVVLGQVQDEVLYVGETISH